MLGNGENLEGNSEDWDAVIILNTHVYINVAKAAMMISSSWMDIDFHPQLSTQVKISFKPKTSKTYLKP